MISDCDIYIQNKNTNKESDPSNYIVIFNNNGRKVLQFNKLNNNLCDLKLPRQGSYYYKRDAKNYVRNNLICFYFDTKYHFIEKIASNFVKKEK